MNRQDSKSSKILDRICRIYGFRFRNLWLGPLEWGGHCFAVGRPTQWEPEFPAEGPEERGVPQSEDSDSNGCVLPDSRPGYKCLPRLPARHGDRGLMGNWFLAAGFSWFFARTVSIVMSAVPNWVGTPLQFVLGSYQLSVCGLKPADGLTGEDLAFRPLHRSLLGHLPKVDAFHFIQAYVGRLECDLLVF